SRGAMLYLMPPGSGTCGVPGGRGRGCYVEDIAPRQRRAGSAGYWRVNAYASETSPPAAAAAVRTKSRASVIARTTFPLLQRLCVELRSRLYPRLPVRDVDRAAECDETGFLDRLRERRVGGDAVRDGLDGRFGVDRDDTRFDHVGHVRADHDEAEQLAVP